MSAPGPLARVIASCRASLLAQQGSRYAHQLFASAILPAPQDLPANTHNVHSAEMTGAPRAPNGRFTNPWPTWGQDKSFSEVFKWNRERKKQGFNTNGWLEGNRDPTPEDFKRAFPLNSPDWKTLENPQEDTIKALWVGHATVLVQMAGVTFITDPVFSQRCAPVQWAGPKRLVQPAFEIEDEGLPKLDFVLLSHNHFDHLDYHSVKRLYKRFGDGLKWYVPLGVKSWFTDVGIHNVVELDWWQEVEHQGSQMTIAMTPAQHWSARGIFDRCKTLWGGYVVKSATQKFFFAGDTGYCSVFKEIGQRYGPIDVSAIPIGAYNPRWFMKPQHVDYDEGLQIHRDVQSRRSLSIHCCTFCLTDEPLDEPPRLLAELLVKTPDADPREFVTLQHGEMLVVRDGETLNNPKLLGTSAVVPIEASATAAAEVEASA